MDLPLYVLIRLVLALISVLPLRWVARLGRIAGGIAYWLDGRHRRVARENLDRVFSSEMTPAQIRSLARENFRRIGENFACAAKTASMDYAEIQPHLELIGSELVTDAIKQHTSASCVAAVGHFGNFEVYAYATKKMASYRAATTYRGLNQPRLNRLLQQLRERSGCRYFERRTEAEAMRQALRNDKVVLGLLVDQSAGKRGLPVPFLGRVCSTSSAPAILALRYDCALVTSICHRLSLGKWRIEYGPEIPTRIEGQPRTLEAIMTDVNRALEAAIRRDPANWFWVHRRWKEEAFFSARLEAATHDSDAASSSHESIIGPS
jgi:lauroyl/myristoyl acyltransferase